jgi:beta-glucosidase
MLAIRRIFINRVDRWDRPFIIFPANAAQAPRPEPMGLGELHAAKAHRSNHMKPVAPVDELKIGAQAWR